MYFVANIFLWLQGYVLNRIVMKVIRQLRDDTEKKLNRLPLNYFDTRQRGDVLSRVTNDVDNVQQALQQAFAQLISSVLTVIGIVIMMFIVSWQLALIALIALPLSGAAAGVIGARSQKLFAAQWKNTGELNGQIEESFSGHDLVRVFGRDADMLERFEERNEALYKASFGAQFVSGIIFPVMQFVSYLSYVGIAVVGGLRVASGSMSLGDATAFIQYSREFTQPLGQMAGMANMLQSGVASAERVFEFLDAEEQDAETATEHLPAKTDGHVEFQDVTFSYTPDKPLIENLSFTAEPGHTVAIVGPTGAGKTTLVNLVMRFYELNAGSITLDGVDVTQLSRAELRSKVGMVLQDAWLFGGTIYDNIRYGKLDATEDQVMAAAKATFVDRFVRALPDGYDTVIDEEGNNVSAGEKQLITIARAFVANPSLLILDEATELGGHPHRTPGAEGHGCAAHRPDQLRDRAPPVHDPRRRHHPGDGERQDRGTGQPPGPPRRRGRLLPAVHVAVRRRGCRGDARGRFDGGAQLSAANRGGGHPDPRRIEVLVPMRWGDMDAYGHINNVQIVRMLEEARIAAFGPPARRRAARDRSSRVAVQRGSQGDHGAHGGPPDPVREDPRVPERSRGGPGVGRGRQGREFRHPLPCAGPGNWRRLCEGLKPPGLCR